MAHQILNTAYCWYKLLLTLSDMFVPVYCHYCLDVKYTFILIYCRCRSLQTHLFLSICWCDYVISFLGDAMTMISKVHPIGEWIFISLEKREIETKKSPIPQMLWPKVYNDNLKIQPKIRQQTFFTKKLFFFFTKYIFFHTKKITENVFNQISSKS